MFLIGRSQSIIRGAKEGAQRWNIEAGTETETSEEQKIAYKLAPRLAVSCNQENASQSCLEAVPLVRFPLLWYLSGLCQVDSQPTESLNTNTEQEKLPKVKRRRKYSKAADH